MNQQELARHKLTSEETIKPGKSKETSVLYLMPPVKLNARKKQPAIYRASSSRANKVLCWIILEASLSLSKDS